ncbi:MAG TPA: succinyl-diaminopimelate desuccinylase [Acidimicrobiales bacterium]|nr:succinyl-diaminopimelate desuccinylase [Acidimicrobiales bacterium]
MTRLEAALELVATPSVSRDEASLAALVAARLTAAAHLEVERVGDNVVARTSGTRAHRRLVAGHLDTVPGDAALARIVGDRLEGVGACDMKGSLAVMLELALDPGPRPVEVTWVFYAREEIERRESGLLELAELRPDLLVADCAVLAEPTGGRVEAGCQGTLRAVVTLRGRRAHTARPAEGRNAVHRLGALIERVARYEPRRVPLEGVEFVEQLQAVAVAGGVAGNVVPDVATLTINHRVAPDRDRSSATAWLRAYLADVTEEGDQVDDVDWAPAAPPHLDHPALGALVDLTGAPARAKQGWTDVATFAERGVPAVNFGAGDPTRAHTPDEFVTCAELDGFATTLSAWLARP